MLEIGQPKKKRNEGGKGEMGCEDVGLWGAGPWAGKESEGEGEGFGEFFFSKSFQTFSNSFSNF
jgi:hypothetical protein